MEMKIQVKVVGAKKYKGRPDANGPEYDNTKLICLTPMDESTGNAKGETVSEYRYGDSSNYDHIAKQNFPFMAELNVQITTNGKTQKLNVTAVRVLDSTANKPTPNDKGDK
ncbi:hypothetical protein ACKLNO_01245 [Neisseriaceae bacterium B1]